MFGVKPPKTKTITIKTDIFGTVIETSVSYLVDIDYEMSLATEKKRVDKAVQNGIRHNMDKILYLGIKEAAKEKPKQ